MQDGAAQPLYWYKTELRSRYLVQDGAAQPGPGDRRSGKKPERTAAAWSSMSGAAAKVQVFSAPILLVRTQRKKPHGQEELPCKPQTKTQQADVRATTSSETCNARSMEVTHDLGMKTLGAWKNEKASCLSAKISVIKKTLQVEAGMSFLTLRFIFGRNQDRGKRQEPGAVPGKLESFKLSLNKRTGPRKTSWLPGSPKPLMPNGGAAQEDDF